MGDVKFDTENKDFRKDLSIILSLLKSGKKFAFSKYADGEFAILTNRKITNCDRWTFDPLIHKSQYRELLSSFRFSDPGYLVGVLCPCCVNQNDVDWMRSNVGVDKENLTWANIFVNGNYQYFVDNFFPEFKNHDIILIANENANIEKLPFIIEEHIKVSNSAFIDNFDLIESLPKRDYRDKLFLFCAGPLGNMLVAKMWKYNKNNTYLDIGSTLNKWISTPNRGYLRGESTKNKICTW